MSQQLAFTPEEAQAVATVCLESAIRRDNTHANSNLVDEVRYTTRNQANANSNLVDEVRN
jgi:hypothetical protein